MSNVFVSVNGRGKYFEEETVIENGAIIEKGFADNYWVVVGPYRFSFNSEEYEEDLAIEVDGEDLGDFMDRHSY